MNLTLETSLKHLHSQMDNLLTDYANTKIHGAPFINSMNELINKFEGIIRENKSSERSYDRSIHIDKSFFGVKNGG